MGVILPSENKRKLSHMEEHVEMHNNIDITITNGKDTEKAQDVLPKTTVLEATVHTNNCHSAPLETKVKSKEMVCEPQIVPMSVSTPLVIVVAPKTEPVASNSTVIVPLTPITTTFTPTTILTPTTPIATNTIVKKHRKAFVFFSLHHRRTAKDTLPSSATLVNLLNILGQMWNNLSDSEKAPWYEKEAADFVRYNNEMKKLVPSLNVSEKQWCVSSLTETINVFPNSDNNIVSIASNNTRQPLSLVENSTNLNSTIVEPNIHDMTEGRNQTISHATTQNVVDTDQYFS
jgi:hypothetical protein